MQVTEFKDNIELQPPRGIHAKHAVKTGKKAIPVQAPTKDKEEKEKTGEDGGLTEPPPKPKKKKKKQTGKQVTPLSGDIAVAVCTHTHMWSCDIAVMLS